MRHLVGPDSEPVHSTYFTRRLESFNDVVFGFSLSLLAAQLEPVRHLPERLFFPLLVFFATFSLSSTMWWMHYQTFHYGFAARKIDVFLNFLLLACAALVPFTFGLTMSRQPTTEDSVHVFLPYVVNFAAVFGISSILKFRGLKRFGDRLEPATQLKVFSSAIIGAAVPVAAAVSIALIAVAGPIGSIGFTLVALFGAIVRRRVKTVSPSFLPAGGSTGSAA